MTTKEHECRASFEVVGFGESETGGGCTAWTMQLDDDHDCLVTDGELSAVQSMEQKSVLSVMCIDHSEPIRQMEFENARDLMKWLFDLCADGEDLPVAILRWGKEGKE